MARLNIEESIYSDRRFIDLVVLCRDLDKALGSLVRAWSLAQKWYLTENRMIPAIEWEKQKMNDELIEVGLVEKVGEFMRIHGADEQFAWLVQRSESGKIGGLRSGLKRSEAVVKRNEAAVKRSEAERSETNPLSPSLSLSLSQNTKEGESGSVEPPPQPTLIKLWNLNSGDLPKVLNSNRSRNRKIAAIWKDNSSAQWITIINRIANSSFCNGKNDRGWKATFDWLLQPDTWLKVTEGKYDDRVAGGADKAKFDKELEAIFNKPKGVGT